MFRNFDNWDVYIDNDRKILAGCIQFMLKDGTTSANIYDSDKVPIENPQITDINGRTQEQVFIDDDIRAYVYKYVGTGTLVNERQLGIDTSDTSKWALQYTIESASIDERAVSGLSAMGVNTMDDLRALDPSEVPEIDGYKIITLNGYFEAGDKEPVNYVWDSQSMLLDDNGSVIMSDNALTGRWILVQPTEHCDSRHFGVFPQDSEDSEEDHSVRMTQLISYCNTHSIRPYFNGSQGYPYFIYQNIAFQSRNAIDVSDDTVFVDKGTGNRFFGEWNGNPYFLNANTTVNSKTVRHSWHFKNYSTGTVKYIVDSTWSPVMLSNIDVEFEISPASSTQLTDCELSSNEKITDTIVLTGMTVHTDWFADDYDWSKLMMVNCKVILQNCKDANTYILLKNKLHEANYGDLGEQTVSNATLLADCIAENASFSNVTLTGNTELHNVSGTITISGAAYQLNFIDCWLTLTNTSQVVLSNIMWRRGSIVCAAAIQPLTTLYLENVDVNASFYAPGVEAKMYDCAIKVQQNLFRLVDIVDCRIEANIMQYPENATVYEGQGPAYFWCGNYFGNKFLGDARIYLAPISGVDYSDKTLGLTTKICNNMSDHLFVDDSLWNGVTKHGWQSLGDFRYQGNTGGCPVYVDEVSYTIPYQYIGVTDQSDYYPDFGQYCMNVPGTTDRTGVWIVRDARTAPSRDVAYDVYWIINLKNVPLDTSRLFKLPYLRGATSIDVEVDITVFIRPDQYTNWPFYTNTFRIAGSSLAHANVQPGSEVAYVSSFRPMKFHHSGIRYCDNDQIDEMKSSLTQTLWACQEHPSYFGFAGMAKYRFSFGNTSQSFDGNMHVLGKTSMIE